MSSRDKNLPYEILTLSHFGFKYCSTGSWLVWAEIKCAVYYTLTKRPMINRLQPVQQSWQLAVRAYCTMYYMYCGTDLAKLLGNCAANSTIGSNSICSGIFGHLHVYGSRIFLFYLKLLPFTS